MSDDEIDDLDDLGGVAGLTTGRFDDKPARPLLKSAGDIAKQIQVDQAVTDLERHLKAARHCHERAQQRASVQADEDGDAPEAHSDREANAAEPETLRDSGSRVLSNETPEVDDYMQHETEVYVEYKLTKDVQIDMGLQEALDVAEVEKVKGNSFYQRGNYEEASKAYERGLNAFNGPVPSSQLPWDAKRLFVPLCTNLVQALLKRLEFAEEQEKQATQAHDVAANALAQDSFIKKARETAERALAVDPTNVKAIFRRGCVHARSEDWNLACDDFELALRLDPTNEAVRDELYNIKDKIINEREAAKEREAMEIGDLAKNEGTSLFQQGQFYAAYEAFQQGLDNFEELEQERLKPESQKLCVALYSNAAQALLKCADVHSDSARIAVKMANKALALEPKSVKALFRRGCALASSGFWDRSYMDFKEVLRLDPENRAAQGELQKVKEMRAEAIDEGVTGGKGSNSQQSHRGVLENIVEVAMAAKAEGNRLFKEGKYDASNKAYQRGLHALETVKPFMLSAKAREINTTLYCNAAQALLRCGDAEAASTLGARDMAERALELDPSNVKALFRRGCAHSNAKEWVSAEADFEAVLRLDPSSGAAQGQLDDIQMKKHNPNDGTNSKTGDDLCEIAAAHHAEGNRFFNRAYFSKAFDNYQEGIDIMSNLTPASMTTGQCHMKASLCCSATRALLEFANAGSKKVVSSAREMATLAIESEPSNSRAFLLRGRVYVRGEEWDLAKNDFEAALLIQPSNEEAQDELQKIRERSWADKRFFKVVYDKKVVLRSEPDRHSCPIAALSPGDVIEVSDVHGSWGRLTTAEARSRGVTKETDAWILLDATRFGVGQLLEPCEPPPDRRHTSRPYGQSSLREARNRAKGRRVQDTAIQAAIQAAAAARAQIAVGAKK